MQRKIVYQKSLELSNDLLVTCGWTNCKCLVKLTWRLNLLQQLTRIRFVCRCSSVPEHWGEFYSWRWCISVCIRNIMRGSFGRFKCARLWLSRLRRIHVFEPTVSPPVMRKLSVPRNTRANHPRSSVPRTRTIQRNGVLARGHDCVG